MAALLSACVLVDVSLERRGCPCVEGWICRNEVCVRDDVPTPDEAGGGPRPDGAECDKTLSFDPENCGACGRSCAGGACKDGVCLTTKLADHVSFPTALHVGSKWMTFVTADEITYPGTAVAYCPRTGCGGALHSAMEILCTPPVSVAASDDDAFWGQGNGELSRGAFDRLPDGGTLHGFQHVASDVGRVTDIALDGTRLFFAESNPSGSLRACDALNLTTCADGGSALIVSGRANLRSLVLERSSKRFFWIDDASGGAIVSCPSDAPCATPSIVVSAQPNAHALAVDAGRVYWTNGGDGTVMSAPSSGLAPAETPTVLAHDLATPWGIAAADGYVYVTTLGSGIAVDAATADGTIVRVPGGGGAPLVLASGLARPWAVTVEGGDVIWTNRGSAPHEGSVESVAK